jgi:4-alpha-glucanotransferase
MKKVKLVFGTNSTQALDLPEHLYEDAYQKAYKPFLTSVYNFPELALTLHYSGPLLSWLERRHPEFITVLREMVERKQAEILGGGFYEPILPLIPPSDRVGQIEMMTTFIRKSFGKRSRGVWIARQIWDNQMAHTLKSCGMEYTFMDEIRFREAGIRESRLFQPVLTEEQGKSIQVFPLCNRIQDMMFVKSPSEVIAEFRNLTKEVGSDPVLSLILSGESLSSDPGNDTVVCDTAWLEEFFTQLEENREWIDLILPSRFVRNPMPMDKRYFSTTSFTNLMEWKKESYIPSSEESAGNCNYRHFLTVYPESNLLYSKMMYTQILTNQVRGDKYKKKSAKEELWKGQNHSPYWHGPGKGIYNIQLRHSAYRFLIESEKTTREKGIFIPALMSMDFDLDGLNEYVYQGHTLNAYCHQKGGSLIELDYLPSSWNYLNTLSRHRDGAGKGNKRDRYLRKAFHDHFFEEFDLEGFKNGTYVEEGDFLSGYYDVLTHNREKHFLVLQRSGSLDRKGRKLPLKIRKQYDFKRNSVELQYDISNIGYEKVTYKFGSEFNLSLPSPVSCESKFYYINNREEFLEIKTQPADIKGLQILQVQDVMNNTSIQTEFSILPDHFWCLPLETPYSDGKGEEELLYQGTTFLPSWEITLFPGESWSVDISLKVGKSSGKAFA